MLLPFCCQLCYISFGRKQKKSSKQTGGSYVTSRHKRQPRCGRARIRVPGRSYRARRGRITLCSLCGECIYSPSGVRRQEQYVRQHSLGQERRKVEPPPPSRANFRLHTGRQLALPGIRLGGQGGQLCSGESRSDPYAGFGRPERHENDLLAQRSDRVLRRRRQSSRDAGRLLVHQPLRQLLPRARHPDQQETLGLKNGFTTVHRIEISTASGSERDFIDRPIDRSPLATARGTDSPLTSEADSGG